MIVDRMDDIPICPSCLHSAHYLVSCDAIVDYDICEPGCGCDEYCECAGEPNDTKGNPKN